MNTFDDIRPYRDNEVPQVLSRLSGNREFIDTLLSIKYPRIARWAPWLLRPLIRRALNSVFNKINTVHDLHSAMRASLGNLLKNIDCTVTVSGLDKLDRDTPYLFISNHRDIAMDPAFVNVALYDDNRETVRIAIGDNLLTKEFTSDLMRVNKSFIVKRSVSGRREKLAALLQLSRYIRYSLTEEHASIWIAQREGRAKDGIDKTEPALLKMLALSKQKEQTFADALGELNVVPVAISYELDPLDAAKGQELYAKQTEGVYEKDEHEDFVSIYNGIVGRKGSVHVAFGSPLVGGVDSADDMAATVDQQIIGNYHLHPTNIIAYEQLDGTAVAVTEWKAGMVCDWPKAVREFNDRMNAIPAEYHDIVLAMYANPVRQKLSLS
ncbi:MAG: 1-acyl-sn-glycerol-3-phosphate acyltransferase [Porticoccus sp.]